ncbi:MAG: Uma2 family endonuclease [Pirellulales bacterium]
MSVVEKSFITPQEYLARERAAAFRSEYYRGEMFAMSGASWEHALIKDNLARILGNELAGGPCRAVTSDLRVKVDESGLYTYPDLLVVCGEPRFEDNVFDTLLNPRILIEVLSDSTEKYDRGEKFAQYRRIESLQEYVMLSQTQPLAERFVRQPDGSWLMTAVPGLDQAFTFGTIAVTAFLAEIYAGVRFAERPAR